jgi:hypothetical protein
LEQMQSKTIRHTKYSLRSRRHYHHHQRHNIIIKATTSHLSASSLMISSSPTQQADNSDCHTKSYSLLQGL